MKRFQFAMVMAVALVGCSDAPPQAKPVQEVKQETQQSNQDKSSQSNPISKEEANKKAIPILKNDYQKLKDSQSQLDNTYKANKQNFDETQWNQFRQTFRSDLDNMANEISGLDIMKIPGASSTDYAKFMVQDLKQAIASLEGLSGIYRDDLSGHGLDNNAVKTFKHDYQDAINDANEQLNKIK